MTGSALSCTVLIDGVRVADGSAADDPAAPMVLDDLTVTWGRGNTLDQPTPASATLLIRDTTGGPGFLELLSTGRHLDVRTDGTVYPDPTVQSIITDPGFAVAGPGQILSNATLAVTGGHAVLTPGPDNTRRARVIFPPTGFVAEGTAPAAWDGIPKTSAGQTWAYGATVTVPTALAAVTRGTLHPVTFTGPWASTATVLDTVTLPVPPGGAPVSATFEPPPGVWIGLCLDVYPAGPAWDDIADTLTWDDVPGGAATLTNRVLNPRAVNMPQTLWLARWFGNGGAGTSSWVTTNTGHPAGLTTAMRKTWTVSPTANGDTGFEVHGNNSPKQGVPVTGGETVTLSGWLRHTSATDKIGHAQIYTYTDAAETIATNPTNLQSPDFIVRPNTWVRVWVTWTVPADAAYAKLIIDIDNPGTGPGNVWQPGDTLDGTGALLESGAVLHDYFDGSTPDAAGIDYAWTGAPNASTSTATDPRPAVTWDALAQTAVDDLVVLSPAAGTTRSALVFSGRVTDLAATRDDNATLVAVTAQDHTAELANRDVADVPWALETVGVRAARIVALSGQPTAITVDPGPAAVQVTRQDVDAQPALTLLQQLATSTDGVLWSATHLLTGQYLHLEDTHARPAMMLLTKQGGLVVIVPDPDPAAGTRISACDVLLDPFQWVQDTADVSTRAAVSWQEQTTPPAETIEHTETVTDPVLLARLGVRRISVTSKLAAQGDAAALAAAILSRTADVGWRVTGLTWATGIEPLTPDRVAAAFHLLDGTTRLGAPVLLTDVPAWSPGGGAVVPLFAEGGRYTFADGSWTLDLTTSTATAQGVAPAWDDLPADWAWDEFDPSVCWDDLTGVRPV